MLKPILTHPIVAAIALALLGPCAATQTGCLPASGWEPGPTAHDESQFPIPGVGPAKFGGERDTALTIQDMTWAPGAAGPSIGQLVLTRSASGPLATRGGQQGHVELQRQMSAEREAGAWRALAMQGFQAATPYFPTWQQKQDAAASQPQQPGVNVRDEVTAKLIAALDKILARIDGPPPTTAPSP